MNKSSDLLLDQALVNLDRAGGDVFDADHAIHLLLESIASSQIVIAQELKKFNDEAELERERQELGK